MLSCHSLSLILHQDWMVLCPVPSEQRYHLSLFLPISIMHYSRESTSLQGYHLPMDSAGHWRGTVSMARSLLSLSRPILPEQWGPSGLGSSGRLVLKTALLLMSWGITTGNRGLRFLVAWTIRTGCCIHYSVYPV